MARATWTFLTLVAGSRSAHSSGECDRPPGPPRPMVIAGMPRLIGTFASVLLMVNDAVKPNALMAAVAALTSGADRGA